MKQSNHLQFDGHLTFAAESCTAIKTGTTEDTAAYAQAQENLPICLLAYAVPIHACIRQQDTSSHAPDFESSAQLGFGTIAVLRALGGMSNCVASYLWHENT